MAKNRFNSLVFMTFLVGLALGSVVSIFLVKKFNGSAMVSLAGVAMVDTATHEDSLLDGAIILNKPTFSKERIYLRFQDEATMNAAIGKSLLVTGALKNTTLDSGQKILELKVSKINGVD
ncbi:MAG: hypothetical protein WBP13_02595 [Methylophilaceae bacterium]